MLAAPNGATFRRILAGVLFFFPLAAYPAQKDRIQGPAEENGRVVLNGSINPRATAADDRGAVDASISIKYMKLAVAQTAEQSTALEKLLEEQRDPGSSDYHNWLTPEEYGERFGLSEGDLGTLTSWLESSGFAIEQVARARNWIAFSGTAGQVASAFQTEIHRYEVDGEMHYANATAPLIPAAFAGVVGELRGLDDFRPKPPRATMGLSPMKTNPDFNSANGTHYLAPDDLATIYDITPLFQAGFNGTGQTLAIAGQTDINLSDIKGFRTQFNLPANVPQLVLYGPDPGVSPDDQIEANLDLEWSGGVARDAKIVYVYSQNVFESVQYAIDQNLASVISVSYGGCEAGSPSSFRTVAQQGNAEGITWVNASGDSGAAGCDWGVAVATHGPSVTFPADIPEVTAVGGTEFNEGSSSFWSAQNGTNYGSALSYIPEKAWNDTIAGSGLAASGGGASAMFAKPWWQSGPGVPADQARDVPDVALSASGDHDAYVIYALGGLMAVGGTSASTPSFAGIMTLINQYVVSKGSQSKPGLGNINPNLYGLAQDTTSVFHDITVGNNIVPCTTGSPGCTSGSFGYSAGPGYDLVTGLGSVDADNLATKWAGQSALTGTTTTLATNPASIAQSATTQLTATVTPVSGTNPPAGSVTFMAGMTSLGSTALVASGSSAKAVLTVKGSSLASGNNTITASYAATGNFSNSTGSAVVNIVVPVVSTTTVVTASPAGIAASGTTQLTATVKAASGSSTPTGSVTFAAGSKSLGTATLTVSGGTATAALTVTGNGLATGNNSIVATYGGSAGFTASSSAAVTVNVSAPLVSTTLTVAASSASIAQSATTVLTATVKAASGTTGPSGSVTFSAGGASIGTATLAISGTSATAALTVKGSSLAGGSNVITASYSGNTSFAGSTATVTVTVTAPPVGTATTATASPPSISPSSTTQLTATVKAASGAAAPGGSVAFTLGKTSLGTATLSAGGMATLTVSGARLAVGSNTITVNYSATGNFTASTASVIVTVTPPPVNTTTVVTVSPGTIAQGATTLVTASVKASTGSAAPTGAVTFMVGTTTLGSAPLTISGATASAALTIKGSSLASGNNTVTATYGGSASFNGSTGSVTVSVTGAATSNVVLTVTPSSSQNSYGWSSAVQLQETAGVATSITGFTINGTSFTTAIGTFFGSNKLAAHGTLSSNMEIQWNPLPATIVFAFTGVDASGHQWSQSLSVSTATPSRQQAGKPN